MRVYRYLGVAVTAALSVTMAATPALADPEPAATAVLTTGALGGAAAAVGDVLTAAIPEGTTANFGTAATGTTGVKCAQSSFTATVVDNPVAPGVATESTTAQTFGSCTANIFGVTGVNSVVVNNVPFATTVESGTGTVTVSGSATAPIQTTLRLNTLLGAITCVYRASGNAITGLSENANNSISFTNQQFNKFSGSITCPANGFFTASYSPVKNTTQAGAAVFTN